MLIWLLSHFDYVRELRMWLYDMALACGRCHGAQRLAIPGGWMECPQCGRVHRFLKRTSNSGTGYWPKWAR